MTHEFRNGAVAGAIAAVLAFLAWTFLKHSSVLAALGVALGFFLVTCVLTMVIANNIKTRRRRA